MFLGCQFFGWREPKFLTQIHKFGSPSNACQNLLRIDRAVSEINRRKKKWEKKHQQYFRMASTQHSWHGAVIMRIVDGREPRELRPVLVRRSVQSQGTRERGEHAESTSSSKSRGRRHGTRPTTRSSSSVQYLLCACFSESVRLITRWSMRPRCCRRPALTPALLHFCDSTSSPACVFVVIGNLLGVPYDGRPHSALHFVRLGSVGKDHL